MSSISKRSSELDYDLSSRGKWMLRLMYTPNKNGEPQPIYGQTRIMKAMFLVQRKLEEEFNTDAGFNFRAYKYGPFDQEVYEALENLQTKGLVEQESKPGRDDPRFQLTEEGHKVAEKLYKPLDPVKKDLLKWVRYKQAERPLGSLLSYVYKKYPDMADKSEIKDRVAD